MSENYDYYTDDVQKYLYTYALFLGINVNRARDMWLLSAVKISVFNNAIRNVSPRQLYTQQSNFVVWPRERFTLCGICTHNSRLEGNIRRGFSQQARWYGATWDLALGVSKPAASIIAIVRTLKLQISRSQSQSQSWSPDWMLWHVADSTALIFFMFVQNSELLWVCMCVRVCFVGGVLSTNS